MSAQGQGNGVPMMGSGSDATNAAMMGQQLPGGMSPPQGMYGAMSTLQSGPPGMTNFPPQAQGAPMGMPRQAMGGPMGQPMTDGGGGFFGRPQFNGMSPIQQYLARQRGQ